MIFSRFKKTVKKQKEKASHEVFPKVLTAEGWNRLQRARPSKSKTPKR